MTDPISTFGYGLQAFDTMRKVAKAFSELKTDIEIQGKVIELQNAILTAQQYAMETQAALTAEREKVEALRAQLHGYTDWSATLEKYELVDAGLGKRLYRLKGSSDPHFICPNCATERAVSILHQVGFQNESLWCPKCDNRFQVRPHRNLT